MSAANAKQIMVKYRPMKRTDLKDIAVMEKICFPDPWPKSAFDEILSNRNHGAIVAEQNNQIVAYGCYLIVSPEAHITNIAVRPEYRRNAIASEILKRILEVTSEQKCEYIILEVRPGNASAIAFYERSGFKLLYRRPRYYRNPVEDALVMVYYFNEEEN